MGYTQSIVKEGINIPVKVPSDGNHKTQEVERLLTSACNNSLAQCA